MIFAKGLTIYLKILQYSAGRRTQLIEIVFLKYVESQTGYLCTASLLFFFPLFFLFPTCAFNTPQHAFSHTKRKIRENGRIKKVFTAFSLFTYPRLQKDQKIRCMIHQLSLAVIHGNYNGNPAAARSVSPLHSKLLA